MSAQIAAAADRALRAQQVCMLIGMGKTWLYAEVAAGRFPAPFKPSERASLWLESEVLSWLREKAARRPERPVAISRSTGIADRNTESPAAA